MNPSPTYTVIYGSRILSTEWVLGTYTNISAAMAHYSRLTAIRQTGEYVVCHVEHPA